MHFIAQQPTTNRDVGEKKDTARDFGLHSH